MPVDIQTPPIMFDPARDTIDVNASRVDDSPYAQSLEAIAPNITGMVDSTQMPGESWTDTLQRILPTIASTWQQTQLLRVQVDRAKAGLPPLDMTQYAAGFNLGLAPETRKMLLGAGLIGLAVVALLTLGGGRGRTHHG